MHLLGAFLLAETDRDHLDEPALDRAVEGRVRLDPIDDEHGVRFGRVAVELAAGAVRGLAVIDDVHGRLDRRAEVLLRHAEAGQDLDLTLRGRAAVAAHGRHHEDVEPHSLELGDGFARDQRDLGDAAAAEGDRDARAGAQGLEAAAAAHRPADRAFHVGDRRASRLPQVDAADLRNFDLRQEGESRSAERTRSA